MKKLAYSLGLLFTSFFGYAAPPQETTIHRQIFIVHGYGATAHDHWFESVQRQMQDSHTRVTILQLPNPMQPDVEAWQHVLEQNIKMIDEQTYFVAHSLGGITLLNFLSKRNPPKIGGVILVAGFTETLPTLPQLDSYILKSQNMQINLKNSPNKHLFISENDEYVPPELSIKLAKKLDIPFTLIPKAGHFLAEDGYTDFPQLARYLKEILIK